MRRFLLIVIIIVIVVAGGWLGYLVWQKLNGAEVIVNPQSNIKTEQKTINSSSSLQQITEIGIANFWANASSDEIFLINYDGSIEKIAALDGRASPNKIGREKLTDNGLKNIFQVIPSPDGSKALINLTIFDTGTNLWTSLPSGATAAAWDPSAGHSTQRVSDSMSSGQVPSINSGQVPSINSGQVPSTKIAYLTNDGLYNLNLKDGKTSLILKLNNRDWQIEWPNINEVYLKSRLTSVLNQEVWKVNLKDKTITRSTATSSFKCFNFYCAKPTNQVIDNLFLDNYFKRKVYTNDSFYFGAKLILRADEGSPIDAIGLTLYKDKLLFINRYDQKLYSLDLK